jgi:hypothetical protein
MAADPDPTERLERFLALGLAAGRIAIGAGLWLAPRRSARALGFDELDAAGIAVARVAATRDLVLGAWQLAAIGDPPRLASASAAAATADAGDALTFALALGDRGTRRAGLRGLPAATAATALGAWLAVRARTQSKWT